MKLYLARGDGERCTLTLRKPVLVPVLARGHVEVYCQPGDAVLIRNLCPAMVRKCIGRVPEKREVTRIQLEVREIPMPDQGHEEVGDGKGD